MDVKLRKRGVRPCTKRSCSASTGIIGNPVQVKPTLTTGERQRGKVGLSATQLGCRLLKNKQETELGLLTRIPVPVVAADPGYQTLDSAQRKGSLLEEMSFNTTHFESETEPTLTMSTSLTSKLSRQLCTKRREYQRLKKNIITQQRAFLECYATLKEKANRYGSAEDLGDVRIVCVESWPPQDLMLLIREDLSFTADPELSGVFAPHVLQKINVELKSIPDDVRHVTTELLFRRSEVLELMSASRYDRHSVEMNNMKKRKAQLEQQSNDLLKMTNNAVDNFKNKVKMIYNLVRLAWIDRESLIKKNEKLHKEVLVLRHLQESKPKEPVYEVAQEPTPPENSTAAEELQKERMLRESLKETVTSAENMLRVARTRILTLEKQLKEARTELVTAKNEQKELEKQIRHRETCYDARSRRFLEVSKTGEVTIEALSQQRDALENRVKELLSQISDMKHAASQEEDGMKKQTELLRLEIEKKDKVVRKAESQMSQYEEEIKQLRQELKNTQQKSKAIADIEHQRCMELFVQKEIEPTERETHMWKELQEKQAALTKTEEALKKSREDKEKFLQLLSQIAEGHEPGMVHDTMTVELVEKEGQIMILEKHIHDLKADKTMSEKTVQNLKIQISDMRIEIQKLRQYYNNVKEHPHGDLEIQVVELQQQVQKLNRERASLLMAAASRALMLERHERSAELFARVTRLRNNFVCDENEKDNESVDERDRPDVIRSLTSLCVSNTGTWSALRAERTRVLALERALFAQSLQLERERRVRMQLENRRTLLERECQGILGFPINQSAIMSDK